MIKMSHEKPSAVERNQRFEMFTAEYAEIAEGRKNFRKIINNIFLSFSLCPLRPLWYIFREFAEAAQIVNYVV